MTPRVTVAVPSFNQAAFLNDALASIFSQPVPVEVFVADGGSTDNSVEIIKRWAPKLAGWRSGADGGQAAAINEAIACGSAPYVCWLNSDDWFLPGGLARLVSELDAASNAPAVYGRCRNASETGQLTRPVWVEPFNEARLATRCIISQPGTLIRRSAWEQLGGVDATLHMVMDYDLWWRLYREFGPLQFFDAFVAVNRQHADTKTQSQRRRHYREAMAVVRKYYGRPPLKWWLFQPYSVWYKGLVR